jgi:uncharacterized protein
LITASFRHIRGIGAMRERQLWARGIDRWTDLPPGAIVGAAFDARLREGVAESELRFEAGDLAWFAERLPETEHWRLLPDVLEDAGFVDVETADDIAVIGVLDRDGPRSFVRDVDAFPARASRWKAIVTFNGGACDLPHLRRRFPAWQPPRIHVDLCHVLRRAGEKGGLKEIEQRLGLHRPPHLGVLGLRDAAQFWNAQREGNPAALRRLVEYNLHDAFHLRPLAEIAYNRLVRRIRMPAPELPVTDRGALLYDVSRAVERALNRQ